jgi:hypothetical protein
LEAHSKLRAEHQEKPIVGKIYQSFGLPNWKESFAYTDSVQQKQLVVVPFVKPNERKVAGLLAFSKGTNQTSGDFVIMPISRDSLLALTSGTGQEFLQYAKLIHGYEKRFFNTEDESLEDCMCNMSDERDPPSSPPTPPGGCEWGHIEVCTYSGGGGYFNWVGGIDNIPPHLDHDKDGVPNFEDQDFIELAARSDMSLYAFQSRFEQRVFQFWDESGYDDRYGDYADAFTRQGSTSGGDDLDFSGMAGFLTGLADDIEGFLDHLGGIFAGWFDGDVDCPRWPVKGVEDRNEIICRWFTVEDCGTGQTGPGRPHWRDQFERVFECYDCSREFPAYVDMFLKPTFDQFNDQCASTVDRSYWIDVIAGCMGVDFNSCIEAKLDHYKAVMTFTQGQFGCEKILLVQNPQLFASVEAYVNQDQTQSQSDRLWTAQLMVEQLQKDAAFFTRLKSAGWPLIGTEDWANTLDFGTDPSVSSNMNPAEIAWSILHPAEALIVNNNIYIARIQQQSQYVGTTFEATLNLRWLGIGDAFLHTYWNALNTRGIGYDLAKEVGDNHEYVRIPELRLEWEMDLHNNEVGRQITIANPFLDPNSYRILVLSAIQNGDCRYLKPVDHVLSGTYAADCQPACLNGILPTTVMLPTNQ